MPTSRDPHTPPLDIPGAVLSIVGLGTLVWAIIAAGEHGWTATGPLTGFAVAAVFLGRVRRVGAAHGAPDAGHLRSSATGASAPPASA